MKLNTSGLSAAALLAMTASAPACAQPAARLVNAGTPQPECTYRVNFDRNTDLPGYRFESQGERQCVPFLPTSQLAPADYAGTDYYAEEFTDAKIRARWAQCKKDPACAERVLAQAKPFVSEEKRDTGTVDPVGRIDPEGDVDLKRIRRPTYFGPPPYGERIARAEPRAHTVEFTVPRDSYERLHLKKDGSIKLRGWYLLGGGVDDGTGSKLRALVILNNGGGGEVTGW